MLPRTLHPYSWWGYAVALALVASSTTNPIVLFGLIGVVCLVAVSRRGDNPWADGLRLYLYLAAFIVLFRMVFRVFLGGGAGPTIILDLPEIPLPSWASGIQLLGPVSLESLLDSFYTGLQLACIIVCIGAANSLVNPKRLLAVLPAAFYELGTVLTVSLSVFPQLADSLRRVQRVRRLRRTQARSHRQRLGVVESIIVPVFSDALERSIMLAASMDARGYGRSASSPTKQRNRTALLGSTGVLCLTVWSYFLLAGTSIGPNIFGYNLLEVLLLLCGVGLILVTIRGAGQAVSRTRYRPERWGWAETLGVCCGILPIFLTNQFVEPAVLTPTTLPAVWPELSWPIIVSLIVAVLPAFLTPPPKMYSTNIAAARGRP